MQFLTQPGEPLLSATPPMLAASRAHQMATWTGLDSVVSSCLVATPIPAWPLSGTPAADALRHPLLWLPAEIVTRQALADGHVETDDEWAVRLCAQVAMSGLYNQDSGEWFNILDTMDLNPETSTSDAARIAAWQQGQPDTDLDSINLVPLLVTRDDPGWAGEYAASIIPMLRQQLWQLTAVEIQEQAPLVSDDMLGIAVEMWLVGLDGHPRIDEFTTRWTPYSEPGALRTQLASDAASILADTAQ